MIIVFDLDDTLYAECSYVTSGFQAVADFAFRHFGWDATESQRQMLQILDRHGRGAVFDRWLAAKGVQRRGLVRACLKVYRHHCPQLELYPEARALLPRLSDHPLYVVTDGHKIVQSLKAKSLKLDSLFRNVYITHRYGVAHAKPSTHCFDLIRKRERAVWRQIVYIGDNPAKDFVGLNPLGAHTVRVRTGAHRAAPAKPDYEAHHVIGDLSEFPAVLARIEGRPPKT